MPGTPVVLDELGGLVATARPEDLPEGASPRCYDVDFVVGRFIQRPGEQSVYSYANSGFGPNAGTAAADVSTVGNAWSNPANILLDDGSFASVVGATSGSPSSNTSAGSNTGGGVPWTNPGNIDSAVSFASVSLSTGGANYTPSQPNGSVINNASSSNQNPPSVYTTLGGFPSVPCSGATVYVPIAVNISASQGGGAITLLVSQNSGGSWVNAGGWSSSFSGTVPIALTGLTNLNTVKIQIEANAGCSPIGYANVQGAVTGWNATIAGSVGLTAQTLQAAISGLSVPANATINGVRISFQADYAGVSPSFQLGLNVGTVEPSFMLTTSPATYYAGGPVSLWGYSAWTAATISGLHVNFFAASTGTCTLNINSLVVTVYYSFSTLASDHIQVTKFGFSVPSSSSITGIGVNVKGYSSNATLYAQMLKGGVSAGNVLSIALPVSNAFVALGGSGNPWGVNWLYSDTDSDGFGVAIWVIAGSSGVSSYLDYVDIVVYGSPSSTNFLGIVPSEVGASDQVTLLLDANGLTWEEDLTNDPNVISLQSLVPTVVPGSYLDGLDAGDGVAYLAYSDLTQGTSQPMQFNGQWADRITQVGPGQAPTFTPQQSTSDTFDISQITQPQQMSDPGDPGHFQAMLQSAGPGSTSPGNVVTIYYKILTPSGPNVPDMDLVNAFNSGQPVYVYMSGLSSPFANGTYQVTSVGQGVPPSGGAEYGRFYFTYNVVSSSYAFIGGPDTGTGYYNRTLATMQTVTPVPGLSVGNQITISGNSQASYNAQWTITQALNSGQMGITSTSVTSGVATYDYAIQLGQPPVTGELVTVTNTTNANGSLNVTNATIASSTAYGGSVSTSGTAVTWVSGDRFSALSNGQPIAINGVGYTISTVNSATSITLTATAGSQAGVPFYAGTGNTGSFTIDVPTVNNYVSVPESGQATTAGTLFTFDPGFAVLGTATDPIYGGGYGGSFVFVSAVSQLITAGVKQGSVFFITRNGAVTRPAPPVQFTVPSNCGAILVSQIPVGPPNVVARGITFTESGQNGVKGASFYFYDTPVPYVVNGAAYVSDALIINDNVTTSAAFAFTDAVLLASDEIDVPGNNYFNLIEIGSPTWMFQYATQMLYGLCQTKIQNMLNLSFDGGYLPTGSELLPLPSGWSVGNANFGQYTITGFQITGNVVTFTGVNSLTTGIPFFVTGLSTGTYLNNVPLRVIAATGMYFSAAFTHANVGVTADSGTAVLTESSFGLVPSLDFGDAFRVINLTGTAWTDSTIIFQGAYQDYQGVSIIQPNTAYSVRLKARSLNANGQQVTLNFLTSSGGYFGPSLDSATFTVNQGSYTIQTAPIITGNGFVTVPSALEFAVGVNTLAVGAGVEIDRIEIFPTNRPVDTTTIWMSYAASGTPQFEAVDGVTGSLGVGSENPQPAQGAFEILEQLYIEKTNSQCVTQDSPNYEPNQWQVRQTSDRAGAVGPNAFDEGEEFTLSASRNGVYFFDGGKPMPINRELQSTASGLNLWDTINWSAGKTIWLRNDLQNRRVLIGIPMITPNFWLPNAPPATPTSPNVILMCNYTGCPTGEELAASSEVHITMFGDLKALDMRRKWALWQIQCPIAEFVPRGTLDEALLLCNGTETGKVYQLVNGSSSGGQNTDDGSPINWLYTTTAFVKAKAGQQNPGLGALRKIWYYLAATMEGVGQVAAKLYSNSLGALARNTFTVPLPFTLSYPQQNDQERTLEIGGQRVFIEFSSIGAGGYAEVGPVMLDGEMDKISPHRGVSS